MQAPLQAKDDSRAVQTETASPATRERTLVDNRPVAVPQRELAEMMNSSPRVLQQRALSDAIRNSPPMVAQRHEMNALFGLATRPQGAGAMTTALSPARREQKPNSTGLPRQLMSGIESLSGMSHLATGQERHLPHEAWRVLQQAQGRVRPALQLKAGAVNGDPSRETEACLMGEKAAPVVADHEPGSLLAGHRAASDVTQCFTAFDDSAQRTKMQVIQNTVHSSRHTVQCRSIVSIQPTHL